MIHFTQLDSTCKCIIQSYKTFVNFIASIGRHVSERTVSIKFSLACLDTYNASVYSRKPYDYTYDNTYNNTNYFQMQRVILQICLGCVAKT